MFELYLLIILLFIIITIAISSLKIGISPMPSSKKVAMEILALAKNSAKNEIIDLGSGFGSLAIFLAINIPHKKVLAYEVSFFPYIISKVLKTILRVKNLEIYKKDFLKEDLKNSLLVCYLFPKGMQNLEDKLFDETINTEIISSTFAFRHIKFRKKIEAKDIYRTPIYFYKT